MLDFGVIIGYTLHSSSKGITMSDIRIWFLVGAFSVWPVYLLIKLVLAIGVY